MRPRAEPLQLPTLGVHLFGTWLTTGWHVSMEQPPVAEMPTPNWKDLPRDWWPRRERAADFPEWDPVERALDEWRDWLGSALRSRLLPSPRLDVERIWATARVLAEAQTLYERPLAIDPLRQRMELIGPTDFLVHDDYLLPFGSLGRRLDQLEASGAKTLEPPWPVADLDPPVDGRFYSSERLERAQRIYEAAIDAYRAFVLTFFPTFAPRLYHFQIFPARLVGEVLPPGSGKTNDGLVLHWHPLGAGGTSAVALTVRTEQRPYDPEENERIWDLFRRERPHMRSWPGRGFQMMDLWNATPALNIVYEWLWDDLKALHWVVDSRAPEWTIS